MTRITEIRFTLEYCSARTLVCLANAASQEVDDTAMAPELSNAEHKRLSKRFEDIVLELKTPDKWKDFKNTFGPRAELSDYVRIPHHLHVGV